MEWKDIPGYEGYYQVSNYGSVRRIKSKVVPFILKGTLLHGYPTVNLARNGKHKCFSIHRLVGTCFLSKPDSQKTDINHKDGIKHNNHVDNLEWVTSRENIHHAIKTGLTNYTMVNLPNGCRRSEFNVYPDTWEQAKAFDKQVNWYITYRFYQPDGTKRQFHHRGMNLCKTFKERKHDTKKLLDRLKADMEAGFNPILSKLVEPVNEDYEIDPKTPFIKALRRALAKVEAEDKTKQDIKNVLTYIDKSAIAVKVANVPIADIKRRHIRMILDHCKETKEKWSINLHNHYRKYLSVLFTKLVDFDTIEQNPVKDIKKLKAPKKIKETLTDEQRRMIDRHLRNTNYTFWRYLHIFFHSGARTTELFRLQAKDVDLIKQRYKVTVKKGAEHREVYKTIKDVVLPLWMEIMTGIDDNAYLFAYRLKPSLKPIKAYQISKRWARLIKEKRDKKGNLLFPDVKAGFYSLKHLNTSEIVTALNEADAAKMNSHTTTGMVKSIYDVNQDQRQHERLKKINNKFA